MKLSDINEKTEIIKDFSKQLSKTTKQRIASTVFGKIKRTSGISVMPVDFTLENLQVVTLNMRIIDDKPDIFRVDINGKAFVSTGDFSNEYKPSFNKSVAEVGKAVLLGQDKFNKSLSRQKAPRKTTNKSTRISQKQTLANLDELAQQLDQQIEQKQAEKQVLIEQLQAIQENV